MAISFECPQCGKRLKAPDSAAGKSAKCPDCGTLVTCPEPVYDAEVVDMEATAPAGIVAEGGGEGEPYALLEPVPAAAPGAGAENRRPCPMCGEMIVASAAKCRYCGEVFDPALRQTAGVTTRRYKAQDESLSALDIVLAVLCNGIACILGIVWMIQGKPKGIKMVGLALGVTAVAYLAGIILGIVMQAVQKGGGP